MVPTKEWQDISEGFGGDLEMPISEQTSAGTVKDGCVELCQGFESLFTYLISVYIK